MLPITPAIMPSLFFVNHFIFVVIFRILGSRTCLNVTAGLGISRRFPGQGCGAIKIMLTPRAAGLGLEPRLMEPESIVLPLDDPAALGTNLKLFF